jgi:hypothetical protein
MLEEEEDRYASSENDTSDSVVGDSHGSSLSPSLDPVWKDQAPRWAQTGTSGTWSKQV